MTTLVTLVGGCGSDAATMVSGNGGQGTTAGEAGVGLTSGTTAGSNLGGGTTGGTTAAPTSGGGTTGTTATAGMEGDCDAELDVIVRDFKEDHPDFESYNGAMQGLVAEDLGPDKKPVYAPSGSTDVTTGKSEFDQWYRDVDGVNMRVTTSISLNEESPGVFVYDNSEFFPVDNMGFGNGPLGGVDIPGLGNIGGGDPGHNFLFTTEAHTLFTYSGGEVFTFRGDDDLWVFINDKLAVDLGGVHGAEMGSVDLDAEAMRLGIEEGQTYPMDIFHAERHTTQSNYRIETTIDLSCIQNVEVPVI